MSKRLVLLLFCLTSCHDRQMVPPANAVHFDLAAPSDGTVFISSTDVQAFRHGNDLILRFDKIAFSRNPTQSSELGLDRFTVNVTRIGSNAPIGKAETHRLEDQELTALAPMAFVPSVEIRVKNAGAECDDGCIVAASVEYSSPEGKLKSTALSRLFGGSSGATLASSEPAEIHLKSGQTSSVAASSSRAASGPCKLLSERDASAILGQPVVYRDPPSPEACALAGQRGSGTTNLRLTFQVDNDVAQYNAFVQRDDAAVVGIGDRAVWNSKDASINVIKGGRRLLVTLRDLKVPSTLRSSELEQKAVAVAERIIAKM